MTNAFIPFKCVFSVNTYSLFSTVPQGGEQVTEQAYERTERSKAERYGALRSAAEWVSGVSGASEQTERATEWTVKNAIICNKTRALSKRSERPVLANKRTKHATDWCYITAILKCRNRPFMSQILGLVHAATLLPMTNKPLRSCLFLWCPK